MDSIHFTFLTIIIFVIALWQVGVKRLNLKVGSLEEKNNNLRKLKVKNKASLINHTFIK
jgi:hypothetical protein